MIGTLKIIFFIFFMVIVLACTEDEEIPKLQNDFTEFEVLPDQISYDIKVVFTDSSRKKAELFAKRARIYQKNQETILDKGVKVLFFSKATGYIVSTLVSDSVLIDEKTKNMYAGGNVIVKSDSNKTTLTTNLLEWNNNTQKLYSNEYVKIVSPYETLMGYGFESDQNLSNYKVFKVSGEQRNINK